MSERKWARQCRRRPASSSPASLPVLMCILWERSVLSGDVCSGGSLADTETKAPRGKDVPLPASLNQYLKPTFPQQSGWKDRSLLRHLQYSRWWYFFKRDLELRENPLVGSIRITGSLAHLYTYLDILSSYENLTNFLSVVITISESPWEPPPCC